MDIVKRPKLPTLARAIAAGFLVFVCAAPGFGQASRKMDPEPQSSASPFSWAAGYALFLLEAPDFLTISDARRHIEANGGTVAVCSDSRVMTGWIAPERIPWIAGSHGIAGVHFGPVGADLVPPEDSFGRALIGFFDTVVTGQALQLELAAKPEGFPLINDAFEHPAVDPGEVIANLAARGMNWDDGLERAAANKGMNMGNSDALLGTIAVALMFVESDGSIDADQYTWTMTARDEVINQVLSGASWWSSKAASFGKSVTFQVTSYSPDQPAMRQGYEPITRASTSDSLWIGAVMSNLGYSGDKFSQVTAFNNWMKNSKAADWAYTCFFCYNPSPAPTRFTNNYFAYAYLGGPYAQFLYRNNGWAVSDIWKIFAHETGHIFWACDEYYQAGYGGCTSCNACTSFRPVMNGNCENESCNPTGAVACMMRGNSNALCPYTVAQIGWNTTLSLTIQAGAGGTTKPSPASYNFPTGAALTVTALPNASYAFINWTGGIASAANPLTVPNVTSSLTVRANFAGTEMPRIDLNKSSLRYGSVGSTATKSQAVLINNGGVGTLSWTAAPSAAWITASPGSGTGRGSVEIGVTPGGMGPGTYSGSVAILDPGAANSPQSVAVTLTVYPAGGTAAPFGFLDTPAEGASGVTGSIPVTGWVLDDVEAVEVQLKRDPDPADPPAAIGPDGRVFVGYGTFVEGARPDVETAYPNLPLKSRAGWGYMMLTNFLPNLGNGTFRIYAVARDKEGNSALLGFKTFSCDNARAAKPFGTIDTPAQGGDASGTAFVNFGWALTPLTGTIPTDGSTVRVFVDGVPVGSLSEPPNVYDQYRPDVSTLFPGLNNTAGPVGAFFLNTTAYENGAHTIAWSATDNLGRSDGIGSRYFNIVNAGASPAPPRKDGVPLSAEESRRLRNAPLFPAGPIRFAQGYDPGPAREKLLPDGTGVHRVEIPQTGRIEIALGEGEAGAFSRRPAPPGPVRGYLAVGEELRPLPIGSTLDAATGRFSWMPGPGFLGTYDLMFFGGAGPDVSRIAAISVTVKPHGSR